MSTLAPHFSKYSGGGSANTMIPAGDKRNVVGQFVR